MKKIILLVVLVIISSTGADNKAKESDGSMPDIFRFFTSNTKAGK